MNFELTEDQKLLVDTVPHFVKQASHLSSACASCVTASSAGTAPSGRQMGELGWLGVMFPESVGGAGMTFVDSRPDHPRARARRWCPSR